MFEIIEWQFGHKTCMLESLLLFGLPSLWCISSFTSFGMIWWQFSHRVVEALLIASLCLPRGMGVRFLSGLGFKKSSKITCVVSFFTGVLESYAW